MLIHVCLDKFESFWYETEGVPACADDTVSSISDPKHVFMPKRGKIRRKEKE